MISKNSLGLLGLLVIVVLGVMAFASTAQALTPKYLVGKKAVATGLNAPTEGKQIGRQTLAVGALNAEFNCEEFTVNSGLVTSGTLAEVKLTYEECSVLEHTFLAGIPCEVKNSNRITVTGIVLPTELTNGEPAVLVEKINALIGLEGPECPLPLDNIVKGELCLKIENNDTVKPVVVGTDMFQQPCKERSTLEGALGAGVKDKLLYGAQEAFLIGKAEVFLGGATHKGLTVGVSLQ